MKRSYSIGRVLLVLMLTGGITLEVGMAFGEPNRFERAATAKVSIDEAIKAASEKVPGTVIKAELEQNHDWLVWQLAVVTQDKRVLEVQIDAGSGYVIDVEEEGVRMKKAKRK